MDGARASGLYRTVDAMRMKINECRRRVDE